MKTTRLFSTLPLSLIVFAVGCQSCGASGSQPVSEPTAATPAMSPSASDPVATSAAPNAVEPPGSTCEEQTSQLQAWGHKLASLGFAFQEPEGFVALSVASGEPMGTQAAYAITKDKVWTARGDEGGLSLDAAERVFRAQMDVFKTVNRGPEQHAPVPVTVFDATTPWSVVAHWIGVLNAEFDTVAFGYLDGRPEVQLGGVPRVAEPTSRLVREHKASEAPFLSLPMFQPCGQQGGDDTGSSGEPKPTVNAYSAEGRTAMVDEAAARFRECDCKVSRAAFEEGLWLDLHGPGVILTVETAALGDPKVAGTTVLSAKATTPWSEMSPRVLSAKGPIALRVTP